jgi:hypothetical protein
MNRPLVILGTVLALAGLALMISVFTQSAGPDPGVGSVAQIEQRSETGWPSYAWPIVAGLTLAIGAACIMIGMNRWQQRT